MKELEGHLRISFVERQFYVELETLCIRDYELPNRRRICKNYQFYPCGRDHLVQRINEVDMKDLSTGL